MSERTLSPQDAAELDTFIDHLWLEDGLSKNTLESYRRFNLICALARITK